MGLKLKARSHNILLLQLLVIFVTTCCGQRSPFSLQAAVDELHRQEYPLNAPPGPQSYFMPGALGSAPEQEDYLGEDAAYTYNMKKPRNRLNKQLAKYLERENYIADHGGLTLGPFGGYEFDEDSNKLLLPQYRDDRKRSSLFRERSNMYDDLPASLFREREIQDGADNSELTDKFLREIEQAEEHERQVRYKDVLRDLWEKYQQQDNQIGDDIYEDQKKRMHIPPYYMLMQRKRSYPVLPWLPYNAERKKRFPISKRSTSHTGNDSPSLNNLEKTDENVEKELSELFGNGADEKKKRSITSSNLSKQYPVHEPKSGSETTNDMRLEIGNLHKNETTEETSKRSEIKVQRNEDHLHHAGHTATEHNHGKRSNPATSQESHELETEEEEEASEEEHESEEEEEEHNHNHEHEHDSNQEENESDQAETKRKKKRNSAASKKKRSMKTATHNTDDFNIMRSKKSIDWSQYFGIDRKKKDMLITNDNKGKDMKKRNTDEEPLADDANKKEKRKLDPTKLDNMNKKLQTIEDFIINETIKYTGAHEGINNPEEIQRVKDRVLSRLATAYSLEKMRRALEMLRQSVEKENHLMRNVIDPEEDNSLEINSQEAVKKDKSDEDPVKKKMKKSNSFMRYPNVANEFSDSENTVQAPNRYETLKDAYLGNKNYILAPNQCAVIESIADRCRGVDLLSGDVNLELLPLCNVHQLCYLCGTSRIACDYQYLLEADSVCSNSNECQATARSVLMILRGTPGPHLGPRECIKNSCLYSALREVGL